MSREQSYLDILAASTLMQQHIAIILDAKASEAEKSRNWLCRHILETAYSEDKSQLTESKKFHEQIVEVIEGITKVELGLAAHLKIFFSDDDDSSTLDGMSDLFGSSQSYDA